MVTAEKVVEVEVDGRCNESLYFGPLQRRIRGRFDFGRVAEPLAKMLTNRFPEPIPGQRLRLDFDSGDAELIESLREEENTVIRERLKDGGYGQPPRSESFTKVDVPTWLYWLKRAVESGVARIVKGALPAEIDGTPRKSFFSSPAEKSPMVRLAAAIEQQNKVQQQSNAMLLKILERVTNK